MRVDRKNSNKIDKFKEYLNDDFMIGHGSFGNIYSVQDITGKWLALKQ